MVDVFLIVVAVIMGGVSLGAVGMTYVYFTHPDDKEENMFPKIIVVFTLWIACMNVLCLTLDVANASADGGLDMGSLWLSINIIIVVMVCTIVPFAFFYYEGDDGEEGENSQRMASAVKFTFGFIVVFIVGIAIMYSLLKKTDIPYRQHSMDILTQPAFFVPIDTPFDCSNGGIPGSFTTCINYSGLERVRLSWQFDVTLPVYILALICFIGWLFFSIFGGIGLASLPVDLINDFLTRPVPMKPEEYAKKKIDIGQRASKLLEIGRQLLNDVELNAAPKAGSRGRQMKLNKRTENSFEQAVYLLKKESNILFVAQKLKGGNPIWYISMLILGIFCFGISLSWVVHIIIYNTPFTGPYNPFLNNFFVEMASVPGFPLFGIITFAIYCFYLLWCTINGLFRFGMRVPFLFKIYPMEVGNTHLNAFLANSWLIVLCSIPIVQYCTQSFPIYTRNTSVQVIFGSQIRYLQFFRYFWSYKIWNFIILIFAFLTMFYLFARPNDHSANIEAQIKSMSEDDTDLGVDDV